MRLAASVALLAAGVAASGAPLAASGVCDVTDYGARGDGTTNDTDAILRAVAACAPREGATLLFPAGLNFLSWPLLVEGSRSLVIRVEGTVTAPADPAAWPIPPPDAFVTVSDFSNLTLGGGGIINGSGAAWWAVRRRDPSRFAPVLVKLSRGTGARVGRLLLLDSPKFHLVLSGLVGTIVDGTRVQAPALSPNTDAVDPTDGTRDLLIRNFEASNGDDCVAIKSGTSDIVVDNATCTYGHGISIGSLGENGATSVVRNITVRNSRFVNSQNGCRVKTWQGGLGAVSGITYDGVSMTNVQHPIVVNQFYCPHSQHPGPCTNSSRAVNASQITFRNISGTTSEPIAAMLDCSDASPCAGITLENIDIRPADPRRSTRMECWQAYGTATNVTPSPCLWGPSPPL